MYIGNGVHGETSNPTEINVSKLNTDQVLAVLNGGLEAYLDYGASAKPGVQQDNRAEATPPVARATDRDTALPPASTSILDRMTAKEWAIAGVGAVVVIAVLALAIRHTR